MILRQTRAARASCVEIGRVALGVVASLLSCFSLSAGIRKTKGSSGAVASKGRGGILSVVFDCGGASDALDGTRHRYAGCRSMSKSESLVIALAAVLSIPSKAVVGCSLADDDISCSRISLISMRINSSIPFPSATQWLIAKVKIVPPSIELNCTLKAGYGVSLSRSTGTGMRRCHGKWRGWKFVASRSDRDGIADRRSRTVS